MVNADYECQLANDQTYIDHDVCACCGPHREQPAGKQERKNKQEASSLHASFGISGRQQGYRRHVTAK